MPTTRTPRAPRTPAPTTRCTRAADVDDLSADVDRILKLSQERAGNERGPPADRAGSPVPAKRAPRTARAFEKAPVKMPARAAKTPTGNGQARGQGGERDEGSERSEGTTTVRAVSASFKPSAPSARIVPAQPSARPAASSSNRPSPAAPSVANLSPADRARAHMVAVNAAHKTFGDAMQAGYKIRASKGEWTDAKVLKAVEDACRATRGLRDLLDAGELASKRVDIEKAAMGFAWKWLTFGMTRKAIDFLVESRPHQLKLYKHKPTASRPAKAAAGSTLKALPGSWRELVALPEAEEELAEGVRNVLCQAGMAAWTAVILLEGYDLSDIEDLLPVPSQARPNHPLLLALSVPAILAASPVCAFYRHLLASPTVHSMTHLRLVGILAISTSISTDDGPQRNSPAQVWTHTKVLAAELGGQGKERAAANAIAEVVGWIDKLVVGRNEDRAKWMGGQAWTALMDLWVDLGRRLNDSETIDRALAGMVDSATIASAVTERPTSPGNKSATSRSSSAQTSKTAGQAARPKIVDADAVVLRISGELAKMLVALEKFTSAERDEHAQAACAAAAAPDFDLLATALLSLDTSTTGKESYGKAYRAVERVRRAACSLLTRSDSVKGGKYPELAAACQTLAERTVYLAEELAAGSTDRSTGLSDLVHSGLSACLSLAGLAPIDPRLPVLKRSHALVLAARHVSTEAGYADGLRMIAQAAYNIVATRWKENDWELIVRAARPSCEWLREAVDIYQASGTDAKKTEGSAAPMSKGVWDPAVVSLSKRYEALSASLAKSENKVAALEAQAECIAAYPPAVLGRIANDAPTTPVSAIAAACPDVAASIQRLATLVIIEGDALASQIDVLTAVLDHRLAPDVKGFMYEHIVVCLADYEWRRDVGGFSINICDAALALYGDAQPIRSMRVIVKMLELVASTGVAADRFEPLCAELDRLAALPDLGADGALAAFRPEYTGSARVLCALQTYHADPAADVTALAADAIAALRPMVLPPTTLSASISGGRRVAAALRTPAHVARVVSEPPRRLEASMSKTVQHAAPVFENLSRLSKLISALVALLGLLGHVLVKIEALKLLRALQRNNEDFIDEYALASAELGTEYTNLGKRTRAGLVFAQSIRHIDDSRKAVGLHARAVLHLRYSHHLAVVGKPEQSQEELAEARRLSDGIDKAPAPNMVGRVNAKVAELDRLALARVAVAALQSAQNSRPPIAHLTSVWRLLCRAMNATSHLAPEIEKAESSAKAQESDDPFTAPLPPAKQAHLDKDGAADKGADEPTKDAKAAAASSFSLAGRHTTGLQWQYAAALLDAGLELSAALERRGSAKEADYYLRNNDTIATKLHSTVYLARVAARRAQLGYRKRLYEDAERLLGDARAGVRDGGVDAVELKRIEGELAVRLDAGEAASEAFTGAVHDIAGLEAVFVAAEALMPSPRKNGVITHPTLSGTMQEPLLPVALGHVLRQHAWLLKSAGANEESEELLEQLRCLPASAEGRTEQLFLDGRIALHEALGQFKSDLYMNSLNESTIAMPMGAPAEKTRSRQSTHSGIQLVLQRAEAAFLKTIEATSMSGKVEDVRRACLSVALLRAYQASMGYGSEDVTAAAAGMLGESPASASLTTATTSAITLKREMLDAISNKFFDIAKGDNEWPALEPVAIVADDDDGDAHVKTYWSMVRARHAAAFLPSEPHDLSALPADWAVVSINVTDDRNTLFVSRHQRGRSPLVFCVPLDRQGKREGEDEDGLFTFDAARDELRDIIATSDENARSSKQCTTREDKEVWWETRNSLDKRLEQLVASIEFCWLGAFKTILSPRVQTDARALAAFRARIERIFHAAISATGAESKRASSVRINDALLECFATLPPQCRDEEIEDFVYFVLDLYQFHGVSVALSELDLDAIGVDVRAAFVDLDSARPNDGARAVEHLFLALDKNVQGFPWESIPMLRGRAVSRIPSLPFLLDQVAIGAHLPRPASPSPLASSRQVAQPTEPAACEPTLERRQIDTRKTYYILNPSGDLKVTQETIEPFLKSMDGKGWKGVIGRPPTELEMEHALKEHDLVLYFGHGGGEQYVRRERVRHLPRCAATMLWGCSSGLLEDQGDFDRTGTPWDYVMGGCPSLVANLWDVTDRDIDKFTLRTLEHLHLDAAHVPGPDGALVPAPDTAMSNVQAVNAARDACRLKYLTGAAPVVYGIPMYLH
ncbi:separin protein [Cryptotrichosporon argae]